jgi:hypothetical protein
MNDFQRITFIAEICLTETNHKCAMIKSDIIEKKISFK